MPSTVTKELAYWLKKYLIYGFFSFRHDDDFLLEDKIYFLAKRLKFGYEELLRMSSEVRDEYFKREYEDAQKEKEEYDKQKAQNSKR